MPFPTTLDVLKSTWSWAETPTGHGAHHNTLAIAIMALQAKVGITNSLDTNSLDYKIRNANSQQKAVLPLAPDFYHNNMDSGWIDWYGTTPAITHSSSIKYLGDASLEITFPDTWAVKNAMKVVPVMNLSAPHGFRFRVRCANWSLMDTFSISFWTSWLAAFWICNLFLKFDKSVLQPDAWIEFVVSKADFEIDTGSIDWSAVTNIFFRGSSVLGNEMKVFVDTFWIYKQDPFWNGIGATIICADDGWATQFTNMKPILDKYGLKATFFIIPQAVGTVGYMSQSQIQQLHDEGHTIALHGATALTNFTGQALIDEVNSILVYRSQHSEYRGMNLFALPNWRTNTEVEALLKTKFDVIFSIDEQKWYPYRYMGYRFPRRSTLNTHAPSLHTDIAVQTKTHKWLQVINLHHVVPTATIAEEYSIANFDSICSFIADPVNDIYHPTLDQFIYNIL